MRRAGSWQQLLTAVLLALGAVGGMPSCTSDLYETGDGRYSYLRADFAMLHTRQARQADYMLTDDGDSIAFAAAQHVSWASRPDTLYRALAYHDDHEGTLFSATPVMVLKPLGRNDRFDKADPLTVESVWTSGGYLNMSLIVKTGSAGDSIDHRQVLAIRSLGVSADGSGQRLTQLRLLHAQNGMPEYYSVHAYLSVPLSLLPGSTPLQVSATTYEGERSWVVSR